MASTTDFPPPTHTHHAPRASETTVDIPSSTVISIGLGFVAFAVGILFILVFIRVLRISRAARAARAQGRQVTFAELWHEEGGILGFLTGLGAENAGVGAGGLGGDLIRVRRMLEERTRMLEGLGRRPVMWEVEVPEKHHHGLVDVRFGWPMGDVQEATLCDVSGFQDPPFVAIAPADRLTQPLSLLPSTPPTFADRSKSPETLPLPTLTASLLIKLPSQPCPPSKRRTDGDDVFDHLPELVIGTTRLLPVITAELAETSPASSTELRKLSMDKAEVVQVEFAGGERRARWKKAEMAKWKIEGTE
jgi:hypothetical protein